MLRVGVIGARRARQGIGFHLTRFLAAAGTEVAGVVGTSAATAEEARHALAAVGIDVRAYADAASLVATEALDALVIASPSRTHEAYLRLALEVRLHVLCEKPLCWGGPDAAGAARALVEGFAEAGRHLVVNAQWPFTLKAYRSVCPDAHLSHPRSFWMRLSPRSTGAEMLPDALPHALSLLAAVVPDPHAAVEDVGVEVLSPREDRLRTRFVYLARGLRIPATVELASRREQPRPAGYAFDGCRVRRHVDLQGYRLSFEGPGGRVEVPDPTPLLVRSFVSRVSSSAPVAMDPGAWPGMAHLEQIAGAWETRTSV